jgi:hypothetical protein
MTKKFPKFLRWLGRNQYQFLDALEIDPKPRAVSSYSEAEGSVERAQQHSRIDHCEHDQ